MGNLQLSIRNRAPELTKISILPKDREWGSGYWITAYDLCELAADLVSLALTMKDEDVVARELQQHAEYAIATAKLLTEACVK